MYTIEEILKLPEDEQVAIMEAIQNNLDDFENHIDFIKERIKSIESSNQPQHSWQQIKNSLNERWNTQ